MQAKFVSCIQVALASLALITQAASASISPDTSNKTISREEAFRIATDAYIFGYPLVTMEMSRRMMTNVTAPDGKLAPMGQFSHVRNYPGPEDKAVTTPNADTLYSFAWLDLTKEPYIFSIPNANGRYYLMPMLDAWTNVFQSPGTRTTGTQAQKYAIVGPNWNGKLPEGIQEYKSPTNLIWIIGRTYCDSIPADYAKVHAFQDQLSIVPLSAYGTKYTPSAGTVDPSIDMKTPVRDLVNNLDTETFFKLLAKLMSENPPTAADAPMIAEIAKIGIVPGQNFTMNKFDSETAKALESTPKIAQAKIEAHIKDSGAKINGWTTSFEVGTYGTDYLHRAFTTAVGLGANLPQDAVYEFSETDANGKTYDGGSKYVLHLNKNEIPPAKSFWSLTMYDDKFFFVPNRLNRYTLSSHAPFKSNSDGSVDFYIQKDSPGKDKEANWLPTPDGKFILVMRMYWPKAEVTEGKYTIPAVQQIN